MLKKKYFSILIILVLFVVAAGVTGCSSSVSDKKLIQTKLDKLEYYYENEDGDILGDIANFSFRTITDQNELSLNNKSEINKVTIENRNIAIGSNDTAKVKAILFIKANDESKNANTYIELDLVKNANNRWKINNDPLIAVDWNTVEDESPNRKVNNLVAARKVVADYLSAYKNANIKNRSNIYLAMDEIDNIYKQIEFTDGTIKKPYVTPSLKKKQWSDQLKNSEWKTRWSFSGKYTELDITNITLNLENGNKDNNYNGATAVFDVNFEIEADNDDRYIINNQGDSKGDNLKSLVSVYLYKYQDKWRIVEENLPSGKRFIVADKDNIMSLVSNWLNSYQQANTKEAKKVVDASLDTAIDNSIVFSDNSIEVKNIELDYEIDQLDINYSDSNGDGVNDGIDVNNPAKLKIDYSAVIYDTDDSDGDEDTVDPFSDVSSSNQLTFSYIDTNNDNKEDSWIIDSIPTDLFF